jgi:hypothetical protein
MKESFENQDAKIEQPAEGVVSQPESEKEVLFDAKVDLALEKQDDALSHQELKHDKKTLSAGKKLLAVLMIGASSFLATGCSNSEKPSNDGFTDNEDEHIKQVLKMKKAEIEHMKEMRGYKPDKNAKDFAQKMSDSKIIQPINPDTKNK